MTRFLLKTFFFLLPVIIGFGILSRLGVPPMMTNSGFFDHKMQWLQRHPLKDVRLMAAGSSMTAYALNSEMIVEQLHLPYYNFASWSMQIGDTRVVVMDLVRTYHPDYLVICSSPAEFTEADNPTYRNYTATSPFIREHFPGYFYFSDYHSIHQLLLRKYNSSHLGIDEWGRGKALFEMGKKTLHGDDSARADPNVYFSEHASGFEHQYRELDSLCAWLQQERVKLVFAQAPMQAFVGRNGRQWLNAHFDSCRLIVGRYGGVYLNYYDTTLFKDSLFVDPGHLTAAGSDIITKKLVADLKIVIRQ
ncbi:MAG TPA: hypothetical protein VGQ51_14215 [Puia sp.]|jgi:hypothetical protein|nr:hypothetical protein [Puia sp.]